MSRIRTQPLLPFFWFWDFLSWSFLVGLVLRLRGAACFVACMRKACTMSHGGSEARHLTPPLGLLSQLSLRFLGFWTRDGVPLHTPDLMCSRSVLVPPLPSAEPQSVARKGKWGGNRTVTQMLWTSVGQMQVVFLVRMAPVSSRNPV